MLNVSVPDEKLYPTDECIIYRLLFLCKKKLKKNKIKKWIFGFVLLCIFKKRLSLNMVQISGNFR